MSNTAVVEETEFTRAKTSVWWDIENCCVPTGCDARGIAQTLNSALMKMNYCGPLTISSYGNTNLIPNSVQQALSSTGVSLNHVPSGRKDASDKKILTDMFLWVLDNPAPANLMFITGDGDFSDALHKLRMRRYNILLVHPEEVSASLVACAKTTWLWRSLWPSCCPPVTQRQPMGSVSDTKRTVSNNKLKKIYVPKASNQMVKHESAKTSESAWFCNVCNVACKSFEIFTAHLSSKEHEAQVNQNLELMGEPKNMAASPSECHEKDMKLKDKVVEAGFEASAHCGGSCSVVCPGQTSLDSFPKIANIQENVQDNSHQSQDVQESMKYSEKQSKEQMETCITSEGSGRTFLQEFKGRLESEGEAPLNVDCILSELSRDIRVPKEVREYFDTILKKPKPSIDEIVIEKLEEMPKHGLEMKPGEPEYAPVGETEHLVGDMNKKRKNKKNKSKVTEDEAEAYVCSLCNVVCVSPTVFESHLKGKKHATMIKKQALLDDKNIQDNGHLIEMIEDLQIQPGEESENIDWLEWQNKELTERCATSERSIEELFQNVEGVENESIYLQMAHGIFFELNPEFSDHNEARESFDNIIKKLDISARLTPELEDLPKQNLEMSLGGPGSTSAGATEHLAEYMDNNKVNEEDKANPEAYVCDICNVTSDCPTVFESHLMGRRHAAGLKKQAEVFFDDKKVLEESLQEKDQPREVLFPPKAGGDHEGEARERLDSIKRLELSLEDTSKLKSSEAENTSEKSKKNGAATSQSRVCDWCNVMCTSQMDLDSHLAGKKHSAAVIRHAYATMVNKQAGTKLVYAKKC